MFLDPKNDFAFKKIFGTEKNKNILIAFLNDILDLNLMDVTYLKPNQDPEIRRHKTSVVDVFCKDISGTQYIIEMQLSKEPGFVKRAQYYAAKAYCSQMMAKGQYKDLKEIIFLAITNFDMFPSIKEFRTKHLVLEKDTLAHELRDFSFSFLELTKFNKKLDQLENIVDKWCYFFRYAHETALSDIRTFIGFDTAIERAYEQLDQASWSPEELAVYEDLLKNQHDYDNMMSRIEDERQEAIQMARITGIERGMDMGFEKGIERGIEKGREEGAKQKAIEMARAFLAQGIPFEIVLKTSGLCKDDL